MTEVSTANNSPITSRIFSALAIALAALVLSSCGLFAEEETYLPAPCDDDRNWILVDLYHTRIQNPEDYRLHRDQYNYQGTYGFHRLFEHYANYGYPWSSIREHELSAARLECYDVLFINLVHESRNRPDFTEDEVQVIKDFVYEGGGLFVIGDHSNVYRHAERINPFLEPMGVKMTYHTLVDYPPFNSVSGLGWIMSFDFSGHPINEEVDMISFKTGGPIAHQNPDAGLAFSSECVCLDGEGNEKECGQDYNFARNCSFGDYWDEENERGFYGNWSWGGDESLEPLGPLTLAAAEEYGEGRVVLVGDQNIFGDAWVNLGNNFEFAANIMDWLTKNEDAEIPLRRQKRKGHNIAFESSVNFYQTARSPADGYYTMFIESNRNEEITARATTRVETFNTDTLFIPSSDYHFGQEELDGLRYTADDLAEISSYLESGGQVVISFDAEKIMEPAIQLLEVLADDFSINYGDQTWEIGDEDSPDPERISGFHRITSEYFDVDGLALGVLNYGQFPSEDDYRENAENYSESDFDAYLHDLSVDWGQPFIDAELPDGSTATIARRAVVGDGELIIFVQDGFWRNRTLSNEELLRPKSFFRKDIVEFHHRFLDYLRGA